MKPVEMKTVEVLLTVLGEADVLIFRLDEDNPEKYIVNLNSPSNQTEIKDVFSKLLEMLIKDDITLQLTIAKDYSKGLYKDVCTEYIQDLNREIAQVMTSVKEVLK